MFAFLSILACISLGVSLAYQYLYPAILAACNAGNTMVSSQQVTVYARAITYALSCTVFFLAHLSWGVRLFRVFSLPPLPHGYFCIIVWVKWVFMVS